MTFSTKSASKHVEYAGKVEQLSHEINVLDLLSTETSQIQESF